MAAAVEDNVSSDEEHFELIDNLSDSHGIQEGNGPEEDAEISRLTNLNEAYKREIEKLNVENEKLRTVDQNSVESTHLIRTVTLSKGYRGKFGFERTMNYIEQVFCRTPAKLRGMKKGDEIVSINGVNVEGFTHSEIGDVLVNANGMTTFVLRSKPPTTIWTMLKSASDNKNYHSTIDRVQSKMKDEEFRNKCFEFFISFMCTLILFVTKWMPYVIYAYFAGLLAYGASVCITSTKEDRDKLLSTLSRFKSKMVEVMRNGTVKTVESETASVNLIVNDDDETTSGQNNDAPEPSTTPRTMTLTKNDEGYFGYWILCSSIRKIEPGSSAELQGLQRGDEVIAINGQAYTGWWNEETAMDSAKTVGVVTLTVRYNPELLRYVENRMRCWIITAIIFVGIIVAIFVL